MAVIMVAITGQSFGSSGMKVGRLFWKSFNSMAFSTGVWVFPARILGSFCAVFSIGIGVAYGFAAYHPTDKNCNAGVYNDFLPCNSTDPVQNVDGDCMDCGTIAMLYSVFAGVIVGIIMWFILALFCGILLVILDTTFMCFLLDKEAGVITKPQFHEIFDRVIDYRKRTMKQPRTAEKPPSYLGDMSSSSTAPAYSAQPAQVQSSQPPIYGVAPGPAQYPAASYPQQPVYPQQPAYPQAYSYPQQPAYPQQQGFNISPPPTQNPVAYQIPSAQYEDTVPEFGKK